MDEAQPGVQRIRLAGKRFDGGRLPIDSLVELERYQSLIRVMARAEWLRDNPGEDLPADFASEVSLTIERIEDGSADVFLAFEQQSAYIQYQEEAQSVIHETVSAAYTGTELPYLPPSISDEIRLRVAEIGSTLAPEQSIEVFVHGPDLPPIVVNVETRPLAVERLELDGFMLTTDNVTSGNVLEKQDSSVVGRITELDADKMRYRFESLLYGSLGGSYKSNPRLLEDFRAVLDSSAQGPITRVTGDLQYKNGVPWRLTDTTSLDLFSVDNETWGPELIAFASLPPGWGDDSDGAPITFIALDAARTVMSALDEADTVRPGMFATESGGILLEWSSPTFVHSVEITPDGTFQLFSLPPGSYQGTVQLVEDIRAAIDFAIEGLR